MGNAGACPPTTHVTLCEPAPASGIFRSDDCWHAAGRWVAVGAGYKVDLSALEQTVAKLHAVAADLAAPGGRAKYDTTIGEGALGTNFVGAAGLLSTHDSMQTWIAAMIAKLQNFIDEYGGQTRQAATNYHQQEVQTKQDLYSGS